ncbi:MAG: AIR synthase [Thaumarchaeota archaeon]|nr:MAG: AIR synthase [Nitrososphaerota archaeon]
MVSVSPLTGPVGGHRSRFGKLKPEVVSDIVFHNLGAPNPAVKVGPRGGFDNAVVSIGGGRSLILTSDPVSMIPAIGMKKSAWLSLHHLVSDFTTTGLKPEFAVFDFNLPTELSASLLKAYFEALGDCCKELGISIVAGHTGSYPGGGFTVVGGGVVFGVARDGRYLTPEMASLGDAIILTKGAAIETTAILANSFPETVERELGRRMLGRARSYLSLCSTVSDALEAVSGVSRGGVTSMHDATEGGVLGALHEHAVASGRSFLVEKRRIYVSDETRGVCSIFGMDPR